MYGQIKIHKLSTAELEYILNASLNYRPIVAAHSSIYTNLSLYFNELFKGFTSAHPINVTNTNYLIKEIEDIASKLPPDEKLVAIAADIETLYPKMKNDVIFETIA